jgi:hypothetical protein
MDGDSDSENDRERDRDNARGMTSEFRSIENNRAEPTQIVGRNITEYFEMFISPDESIHQHMTEHFDRLFE